MLYEAALVFSGVLVIAMYKPNKNSLLRKRTSESFLLSRFQACCGSIPNAT
jgi:hypothetical protein